MHIPQPPSIDRGTSAGLWAIGFGLFIFFGALAIGVALGTTFIVSLLATALIFLYIRIYGDDDRRRSLRR